MKEIDLLDKLKTFDDTLDFVAELRLTGHAGAAKHLHELWTLSKHLGTEIRRLRKEVAK